MLLRCEGIRIGRWGVDVGLEDMEVRIKVCIYSEIRLNKRFLLPGVKSTEKVREGFGEEEEGEKKKRRRRWSVGLK